MKGKPEKTGGIALREIIVAVIVIFFLGSSFYMLLLGLTSKKTESRVTAEELKTARAAMNYDDSSDESNVKVAIFENDIVIDNGGAAAQPQSAEQVQPDAAANAQPVEEKKESEYIFPDSDKKNLTDADVAGMSKGNLRLARNEILARHGRIFDSEDLKTYFEGKSWYVGVVSPEDFDKNMDSRLNATELYNIEMIKKYE